MRQLCFAVVCLLPICLVIRLLVGCLIRLLVWCRLGCRFRRGLGARRGIRLRLRSLPAFLRLHDDRKGLGGSGSLTVGDGDSDVIGSRSIGIHIIGGHIRRSERHVAILRVVRGHAVKRIKSVADRNGPVTGGDDGCRIDRSGSTRPNLQRRQRMRRDGDRRRRRIERDAAVNGSHIILVFQRVLCVDCCVHGLHIRDSARQILPEIQLQRASERAIQIDDDHAQIAIIILGNQS